MSDEFEFVNNNYNSLETYIPFFSFIVLNQSPLTF